MLYRPVTATKHVDDSHYRHDGLLFWIYAIATSKTGANLPIKAKQIKAIPKELNPYVAKDPSLKAHITEALEKHECSFIKVEGKGWTPRTKRGDQDVAMVQSVLDWLGRYENQSTVDGGKLIFAVVETSSDV